MDVKKALGLAVKEYRLQQDISQEKFALKIEMDRTYFASVESGQRNIAIENISKIADGLGLTLDTLFARVEQYKNSE